MLLKSASFAVLIVVLASVARAENVTLYAVSDALASATQSDYVQGSPVIAETSTVSAIGTAADGAVTTYAMERIISQLDLVYSDTTVEQLSEPLTITFIFIQGVSTYEGMHPDISTTVTTTETGANGQPTATKTTSGAFMVGYSQACHFEPSASSGDCVYSAMPLKMEGDDGYTLSPAATTYSGPLVPFYTLMSEENGAAPSGLLPSMHIVASFFTVMGSLALGFWMSMSIVL
ncbi:hypothetical protein BD626DRAFT_571466 [Schizophyllum amplum]|uniref:Uncharacterized protein n=1 Tax=Schizophyllum amplum TaxID=97359 RepID=A0A550C7K5_9AGAR|nr:hypothetical protein BD626DRAFT_571466 [Auriculariopsis ampla]